MHNGEFHREGGPSIEYADGEMWWFNRGEIHRIDGPAVIYADNSCRWFIEGVEYSIEEYCTEVYSSLDDQRSIELLLKYK